MNTAPSPWAPSRLRRLLTREDVRGEPPSDLEQGRLALTLVREFEHQGTGWFWRTDRDGSLTYLSAKVAACVVGTGQRISDHLLCDVFHVDDDRQNGRTLAFHLSSRTGFLDLSVRTMSDDGENWWSITGRPLTDELGHFQGFVGSGSDLTEKRRSEAEISKLASYDGLTGLANRQRMKTALDQILAQTRASYRASALMLLDLDRFKAVNDTLGHQTGDALLQQVAQRLQRCIGADGLVGRLGGDEFQVLLAGEGNRDRVAELSDAVIAALSKPYFLGGSSVSIGCSIGIAVAPDDGDTSDTLVRNADLALYGAKADGRGVHRFYSPAMLAGAQKRKRLEDDLRVALAENQLRVAYQPVVSTLDPHITGYEALLRWDHPQRGPISPADFVPIAEECGLIEVIGEWVLRTATRDAATWPGDVRVAVNVSPIQFANAALPATVLSALAASGLAPSRLELEITESVFLHSSTSSEQMFRNLKALGVRLALDDFGTGYSSLGYLRTAPFDKIKIDQSFVRGAAIPGSRNAAIIRAIVTLAATLGMETTAEGVEVQDEIELIRNCGCTHIQGYVYGRPMFLEDVHRQLTADGPVGVSGHKTSRLPRTRMLRWASIERSGVKAATRVRNMSPEGAMIDGIQLPLSAQGGRVTLELADDQAIAGTVRWIKGEQAGIQFDRSIDMDRVNGTQAKRAR